MQNIIQMYYKPPTHYLPEWANKTSIAQTEAISAKQDRRIQVEELEGWLYHMDATSAKPSNRQYKTKLVTLNVYGLGVRKTAVEQFLKVNRIHVAVFSETRMQGGGTLGSSCGILRLQARAVGRRGESRSMCTSQFPA